MNTAPIPPSSPALPPAPPLPGEPSPLDRAARGMEALFTRQLLAQMADRLPGTSGGPGAAIYASLLQDAVASAAAERGAFGLADTLRRHLAQHLPAHADRVDQG